MHTFEEDKLRGACNMHTEDKSFYKSLVRKRENLNWKNNYIAIEESGNPRFYSLVVLTEKMSTECT
jgi:hypothetical protein